MRRWIRRLWVLWINQWINLWRGINGSDRHRAEGLEVMLEAIAAERYRLRQELLELTQYADTEIQRLQYENAGLRGECDHLQVRLVELEFQFEGLSSLLAERLIRPAQATVEISSPINHLEKSLALKVDLSDWFLALVGGHAATRRAVIQELATEYGLKRWVEVPPFSEESNSKAKVKAKIAQCDLVVIITGYMSHPLTASIYHLKSSNALVGELILLNCRGKSGVVREILSYVQNAGGEKRRVE
jgi:hypothetical protein